MEQQELIPNEEMGKCTRCGNPVKKGEKYCDDCKEELAHDTPS